MTDRDHAFEEFVKAVQARRTDAKEWFDDALEATVRASVSLAPDRCRVRDYDAGHARLRVIAPVTYTATVGDFETSWIELRDLDVYADGDLGIDWTYDNRPQLPARARHGNLLDDDFVLSDEHPYRAYADIAFSDTGPRHLRERAGAVVPELDADDYRAWRDKVAARIREAESDAPMLDGPAGDSLG